MTTCPQCGQQTIQTPQQNHLEPRPHPLGINKPDGTTLTTTDIINGHRGHRLHTCPPTRRRPPHPGQGTLPL